MTIKLEPEIVPIGGYNLEYRQDPSESSGYIYSNAGADADAFQATYDALAASISFSEQGSTDQFNKGVLGNVALPITAVIHPYPGDYLPSLPSTLTLNADGQIVEFLLIAKILSTVPLYDPNNPPSDSMAMWQKCMIGRRVKQTLQQGGVLQELVSDLDEGERYMLVSAFGDASEDYDVNVVDGLCDMPLPKGYHYESRTVAEDFSIESIEVAHILVNSSFNFQRYKTS